MRSFLRYFMALTLGAGTGLLVVGASWPADAHEPPQVAARPAVPIQRTAVGTPAIVGTSTIADLVSRVDAAVVNIDTVARAERDPYFDSFFGESQPPDAYEEKGIGSGFVVDPDGLIVTNNHVIAGATTITVTLASGKQYRGRVLGTDPSTDVALVKVEAKGLKALPFAQADNVRVGDWVVAIGSPLGLSHTVSVGIVSALDRDIAITERGTFIQTDAAINPGNSGGPLIDMTGHVVGMNTAIAARGQNIGFAIPAWIARNVIQQLETTGKVVRPYIGVSIRNLPGGSSAGVQVVGVLRGSPAAKAGLRTGDVITKVDGHRVETARDLLNYLARKNIGARVTLEVVRGGQALKSELTLEAMPERR